MKTIHARQSPWVVNTDDGPVLYVIADDNGVAVQIRAVINEPLHFSQQVVQEILEPVISKAKELTR